MTDAPDKDIPLTETEREVLKLLADGMSQEEVAAVRGTSKSTTRNTAKLIRYKLGTNNTTHSVALAIREGWIE